MVSARKAKHATNGDIRGKKHAGLERRISMSRNIIVIIVIRCFIILVIERFIKVGSP